MPRLVYKAEAPRPCNLLVGQLVLFAYNWMSFLTTTFSTYMRDLIKRPTIEGDGGQAEGTHVLRHHVLRVVDWQVLDASLATNHIELSWG
jgi:hypothetical protein